MHGDSRPGCLVPVLVIASARARRPSVLPPGRRYEGELDDSFTYRTTLPQGPRVEPWLVKGAVVLVVLALGIGLFARWVVASERASFARGHQRVLPSMSVGHLRGSDPVGTDAEAEEATRIALAAARVALAGSGSFLAAEPARLSALQPGFTFVDGPSTHVDDRLGRGGSARVGGGRARAERHLLLGPRTPRRRRGDGHVVHVHRGLGPGAPVVPVGASRFDRSGRRVYTPAACPSPTSRPQNGQKEAPVTHVSVTVNGAMREADVEPRTLLVYFLRETLGLTGTNVGCDTSSCGSCTVLLDGESVKSCTLLAAQADGRELTTIEGMAEGDQLHPLQESFRLNHGLQCGYCTPGMIMAAASYLKENPSPSEDDVRLALEGNLCRCTGYQNIVKSILDAAGSMAGAEA